MREDVWAWNRIRDTLDHFAAFMREVNAGRFYMAGMEYAYMMRWYDERLQ